MNRVEPGVPVPNVIVILLLLAGLNPIACSRGESPHQNSNARPNGSITQRTQSLLDGGRLLQNENPQGDASGAAAKKAGRSPKVVGQICQQVGWTRQVSQAPQADQIQSVQVQHMANPPSPPQQSVETKIDNGQQNVEINPGDPKMVYVPQHNPVTIDNTPASSAPTQTTTADTTTAQTTSSPEQKSGVSTGTAVVASLLSPGVVMTVGAANDNKYFPYRPGYNGDIYTLDAVAIRLDIEALRLRTRQLLWSSRTARNRPDTARPEAQLQSAHRMYPDFVKIRCP